MAARYLVHADDEFSAPDGERPNPLLRCKRVHGTGRTETEFYGRPGHAAPLGDYTGAIFCAWYADAELTCSLVRGEELPADVLDLAAEFRVHTNPRFTAPAKSPSLLDALDYFGLPHIEESQKEYWRNVAKRGRPLSDDEWRGLASYCETDVIANEQIFEKLRPHIERNWTQALHRGNFMKSIARMRHRGIPMDVTMAERFREHWDTIKRELVDEVDRRYGVYDGTSFRRELFIDYLRRERITWPHHPTGAPKLDIETFEDMARLHPQLTELMQVRRTMGQLRKFRFHIGKDGRNRCMLSPFRAQTGRNQPSPSAFIFGASRWLRALVQAPHGTALIIADWSQQEFAIAGYLAEDDAMLDAYRSDDPYLAFATLAGLAPEGATKDSHPEARATAKQLILAVQYGLGVQRLAEVLQRTRDEAGELLGLHRQLYAKFWKWLEQTRDYARLTGSIHTVHGWQMDVRSARPRIGHKSLENWMMQSHGADMMRAACVLADRAGLELLAPVHDALMIQCRAEDVDDARRTFERVMGDASEAILPGFRLRSDTKVIMPGERHLERGQEQMWQTAVEVANRCGGVGDVA